MVAATEVGVHGCGELVVVSHEEVDHGLDAAAALGGGGGAGGEVRGTLPVEEVRRGDGDVVNEGH